MILPRGFDCTETRKDFDDRLVAGANGIVERCLAAVTVGAPVDIGAMSNQQFRGLPIGRWVAGRVGAASLGHGVQCSHVAVYVLVNVGPADSKISADSLLAASAAHAKGVLHQ